MPAYRSEAEAEIRTVVVDRLRQIRPGARIMHEVNVCSYGNRVDVLAVDKAEIIAVEIKSKKDKLDRLPAQLEAMQGCAHHTIVALHEKFLVEVKTNRFCAEREANGEFFRREVPKPINGWRDDRSVWIMPRDVWRRPDPAIMKSLPHAALDMLWRDELAAMCAHFGLAAGRRATMEPMKHLLRWSLSGRDITRGICAALRSRVCIEADPEMEWSIAA